MQKHLRGLSSYFYKWIQLKQEALCFSNGRVNEIWVEIHPVDVKKSDIQFSSSIKPQWLSSPLVPKKACSMPIFDMKQPSNSLTARVVDQISGNYNYKMGVANIRKIGESLYKKEFQSFSFAPRNIVWSIEINSIKKRADEGPFFCSLKYNLKAVKYS